MYVFTDIPASAPAAPDLYDRDGEFIQQIMPCRENNMIKIAEKTTYTK